MEELSNTKKRINGHAQQLVTVRSGQKGEGWWEEVEESIERISGDGKINK